MNAELQAMQEAIKAIGGAVADLTAMCEGLPKFLENKIGSFRAEMQTLSANLLEQIQTGTKETADTINTLSAQQAELDGKLNVIQSALQTSVEEVTAKVTQIIADNRAGLEKSISAGEQAVVETLGKEISGLRDRVAAVEGQANGLQEQIVKAENGFVVMVQASEQRSTDALQEATKKLEEMDLSIGRDAMARFERDDAALASHKTAFEGMEVLLKGLAEDTIPGITERVDQNATRITQLDERSRVEVQALQAVVEQSAQDLGTRIHNAEAAGQAANEGMDTRVIEISKRITEMVETTNGRDEYVTNEFTKTVQALDTLRDAVIEIKDVSLPVIHGRAGEIEQSVTVLGERTRGDTGMLDAAVQEVRGMMTEQIRMVGSRIDTVAGDLRAQQNDHVIRSGEAVETLRVYVNGVEQGAVERIADLTGRLDADAGMIGRMTEDIDGVRITVRDLTGEVGKIREQVTEIVETKTAALAGRCEHLGDRLTEVETKHPAELQAVHGAVEEVHKQINSVVEETIPAVEKRFGEQIVIAREALEKRDDDLTNIVDTLGNNHKSLIDSAVKSIGELEIRTTERIGSAVMGVDSRIVGLENQRTTDNKETDKRITAAREAAEVFAVNEVQNAVQGLLRTADADKVLNEVRQEHTQQWTGALAVIEEFRGDLTTLQQFVDQVVPENLLILQKKIEAIQPGITPEQLAELQVRLSASMPELATAPDPEFQLSYEDGQLTVTMLYGEEKKATATVPVEIGIKYRGVYKADEKYPAGHFVTHKGSIWASNGNPTGEPGKDFTGWRLAVKCGRDGAAARPIRTYTKHKPGQVYHESDFLRVNNRLWQCGVEETKVVPEPGDITSTKEWLLIGGVQ